MALSVKRRLSGLNLRPKIGWVKTVPNPAAWLILDDDDRHWRPKLALAGLVALFASGIIAWAYLLRDTSRFLPGLYGQAGSDFSGRETVSLAELPRFMLQANLSLPLWVLGLAAGLLVALALMRKFHRQKWHDALSKMDAQRRLARQAAQSLQQRMEEKIRTRTAELEMSYRIRDGLAKQVQSVTHAMTAQEKMAALGRVVAGIAHEINTPIGVAVTASSLLAHHLAALEAAKDRIWDNVPNHPTSPAHASENMTELRQLVAITEQALAKAAQKIKSFKQIAADQHLTTPRRLEILGYLQDCVNSLHPMVMRAGHHLRFPQGLASPPEQPSDAAIFLTLRPDALWQVLSNLVSNALVHGLAAHPESPGTITLACERRGDEIMLTLADDGVGMDEECRRHMFEPFFTTKRGQGGIGLGLSICHNLVTTALSGRIECDSQLGQGTLFRIFLPIERGE
ncbi:MAG: ATP-binding protein [Candidatus Symbiobacter sp.]|nr:ATP-binding protein [Candidatus Symbiobacter sp.]